MTCDCNSCCGKGKQADPCSLLASCPSWISDPRPEKQKQKWTNPKGCHPSLSSGLHVRAHTCAHTPKGAHGVIWIARTIACVKILTMLLRMSPCILHWSLIRCGAVNRVSAQLVPSKLSAHRERSSRKSLGPFSNNTLWHADRARLFCKWLLQWDHDEIS